MKKLLPFLPVIFFTLIVAGFTKAQQDNTETWKFKFTLGYGYSPAANDWEYSHPFYSETGLQQTMIETGSFKAKSIFGGGVELSKGYFGIGANAGIIPAAIAVDKLNANYNFTSYFLGIEGIFFPLSNPAGKLVPLLKIGGGGMKSSGDLDNSALFYSFGGGVRTHFMENFGAALLLNAIHITYNEIPLDENITGDISFTNFSVQVEVVYCLN